MVIINSFQLGIVTGARLRFYVDDFGGEFFDGLIGADILKNYDVDFDFARGQFGLFAPDHCPGKVVYWTRGPYSAVPFTLNEDKHIVMPITVDDKGLSATVDTGADDTILSMATARKMWGLDEHAPGMKLAYPDYPEYKFYHYPFKTMSFGGLKVSGPHIMIVPNGYLPDKLDILLGTNILRELHMYIAYKEKAMYVTPALAN